MISKIDIQNVATYPKNEPVTINFKKLNFIYGSNGSGKTTISNLIGSYSDLGDSVIEESETKKLVYNRNFVDSNFKQEVPGIFTLGEESIELKSEIDAINKENDKKSKEIASKQKVIDKKINENEETIIFMMEKCWDIQKKIGSEFKDALTGLRSSKQKFYDFTIEKYEENRNKPFLENDIQEINKKYKTAFSSKAKVYELIPKPVFISETNIKNIDLLEKVIIGNEETVTGQFIKFLDNSDWVNNGLEYLEKSDGKCPFCQQEISLQIKEELGNYFELQYKRDMEGLRLFKKEYHGLFDNFFRELENIINQDIPYLNKEKLIKEKEVLMSRVQLNYKKIDEKFITPSTKVYLDICEDSIKIIRDIIINFNEEIEANNLVNNNKKKAQDDCRNLLWEYIISELSFDLTNYVKKTEGQEKALSNLKTISEKLKDEILKNKEKIDEKEKNLTGVKQTAIDINKILRKFNFKGFSLKENGGNYTIVREDGTDAKNTLSEGEYNFVTFLYFCHLAYGSHTSTGTMDNKVIIIDDPISSLDSNVLFIVSMLVKDIVRNCRNEDLGIKQVIVLTHNIYFYKEITFLSSRDKFKKSEANYGIIRKKDNISYYTDYEESPIQSSYQLLWNELKLEQETSIASFNNMRRILEYYFKILGDLNYEECVKGFDTDDSLVCKALISGINDGSHFISDDFFITFDDDHIQDYKRVFRMIFENMGHKPHYDMMMNLSD